MITTIEQLKSEVEAALQSTTERTHKIARETGLNDSTISRYRDGYKISDVENLFILAKYFGVNYELRQ